jgi:hypothetical protein
VPVLDSIQPEPDFRYGLSLAHNDACATIARSVFLACTFKSMSNIIAKPFDPKLFRSVRFRGRTGATSMPGTRFPRRSPTLPNFPRSPLPFRSSYDNLPDQSVQSVPISGSSSYQTFDCSSLPSASLSICFGSTLGTRFVQLDLSCNSLYSCEYLSVIVSSNADVGFLRSDTLRCRYSCNTGTSLFLVNSDCSLFANADCFKVIILMVRPP